MVALRDTTFDVRAGELFGFVGSNGAGKTTTMRIALGVLAADAGEVRWDGEPVTLETRRHIGYMPEERGLYPKMKVGEQLVYLARLHGLDRRGCPAVDGGVDRAARRRRTGRATRCRALSLGNQQRVQLAAALVHNPSILVLDEPFSGLDPIAVDVMSKVLLDKAAAGIPVVFSSHQLELVERLCHRVGIIRSGQMVAVGTVDELRSGGSVETGRHGAERPTRLGQRDSRCDRAQPGERPHGAGAARRRRRSGGAPRGAAPPDRSPSSPAGSPSLTELYRDVVTHGEAA